MYKLQNAEEHEANARADDGAVHADPEKVRLDFVVDEVIELFVGQA